MATKRRTTTPPAETIDEAGTPLASIPAVFVRREA